MTEVDDLYPPLSLEDVHTALGYYDANVEDFREADSRVDRSGHNSRLSTSRTRSSSLATVRWFESKS